MSLGWFEKRAVGKTVKKVIGKIMRNVDQTIEKNPDLTVNEALKIVDRQQGVFFPAEKSDGHDMKSLFALIVWKGYRNLSMSDPDASSPERREYIYKLVYDYLNDQNATVQSRHRRVLKPVAMAVGICAVILLVGVIQPFHPRLPSALKHPLGSINKFDAVSPDRIGFKYYGYAADDYQKLALVNKSVYHEGDFLDDNDAYVLKNIYPRHIVIQNMRDRSEFSVYLQ